MYRIRMHGRGGQGVKTAARILGQLLFLSGYQVQDAPRYGAERRGAPIFAYVRAAHAPIRERGVIQRPDLVVVLDDTLLPMAQAGVLAGVDEQSVLLLLSDTHSAQWRERQHIPAQLHRLPALRGHAHAQRYLGVRAMGAAAVLLGQHDEALLREALAIELAALPVDEREHNLRMALQAAEAMDAWAGSVGQGADPRAEQWAPPAWVDLPLEPASCAAPAIHAAATSEAMPTGLWRTLRPVIDHQHCFRCRTCTSLCPDGAIRIDAEGLPQIDYAHCKGCLICLAECPAHTIHAIPEPQPDSQPPQGGKA